MNRNRLLEVLPGFQGKRVLVVGDLILDEYLVGRPTRISREAPVLILEYEKRYALPGGGTNPARNLSALGAEALMVGIVGTDEAGSELRSLLGSAGVRTDGIVADPERPTITKTRILAQDRDIVRQQVVRMDRLPKSAPSPATLQRLVDFLEEKVPQVDAVLLSDYKNGVISPQVVEACSRLAKQHGKLVTADSQGDLHRFSGFSLVKANQAETAATLGCELDCDDAFENACQRLLDELGAKVVMITRGANGMSVMESGGRPTHIPVANRSEVFDVTGAGDTVIAVATLALAAGARAVSAAHLANYAAGLVVRKIGNATTNIQELSEVIVSSQFPKVDPEQEMMG
ncbi:MAG TPA: PfkB family carbohydrate kinase [Chloroflexota bacterium]|nr:PfkB family carbohydrate kinase [Chloroflexota bacterium]